MVLSFLLTKTYLARFGRSASNRCSCGAVLTTDHLLLSCKWLREERPALRKELEEDDLILPLLLQMKNGIAAMLCFLENTKVGHS